MQFLRLNCNNKITLESGSCKNALLYKYGKQLNVDQVASLLNTHLLEHTRELTFDLVAVNAKIPEM